MNKEAKIMKIKDEYYELTIHDIAVQERELMNIMQDKNSKKLIKKSKWYFYLSNMK